MIDIFYQKKNQNMKKKKYYEKIYITTISICSEYHSRENETYIPKKLVDLTNSDYNEKKIKILKK